MPLWGNKDSKTSSGTITISDGTVTGSGTSFTTQAKVNDYIIADDRKFRITSITNNTIATVTGGTLGEAAANVGAGNSYVLQEAPVYLTTAQVGTDANDVFGVDTDEASYDTWTLHGVSIGSDRGSEVVLTSNASTGFQVNGGTATVDAVISVTSLVVGTVDINAAGEGYTNGDVVSITGSGTGTQAQFTVTANATGNVTAVAIHRYGEYSVFPNTVANTANVTGDGTGLKLDITSGVGAVSISNAGKFTALPAAEDDNIVTAQADQTDSSGTKLNLVFKKDKHTQHPGWVLVKNGSGNRSGRRTTEVLVASRSITGDAEDTEFANT